MRVKQPLFYLVKSLNVSSFLNNEWINSELLLKADLIQNYNIYSYIGVMILQYIFREVGFKIASLSN